MQKRLIWEEELLEVSLDRLAQQVIENCPDLENTVVLGMQPRGVFLAERICQKLEQEISKPVPMGTLDVTFYRDDFRRQGAPLSANKTHVPFLIEDKTVILVDDVLYTGRSVRAALDAMLAFGRPAKVEMLTLVDRQYGRDLPIEANYVGKKVQTLPSQHVLVEWQVQGHEKDRVWLIEK